MSLSLNIIENHPLKVQNTLGIQSCARYFIEVDTIKELQEALRFSRDCQLPLIPLGCGSNVVFSNDLKAVVVRINLKERTVCSSKEGSVLVRAGAGECWHDFVLWALDEEMYGLENLSLIPGTVGAAPIQNIGAYGVELKDFFHSLDAVALATGRLVSFDIEACNFGYRDSVFKHSLRDQFIITSVTFQLDRIFKPRIDYDGLRQLLSIRLDSQTLTAKQVSELVCRIRSEKLPDPAVIPNVGSFFKNPVVTSQKMSQLRALYSDIVAYPVGEHWKLGAGWLIESAGMRGIREGDLGTFQKQALVIVNYGEATGKEVIEFSEMIRQRVLDKFEVLLEREPRVYPEFSN